MIDYHKAPFSWFGGKSQAAPLVWQLLGDPAHYVEPFCGTMAVLLNRPHPCNRTYHSETVNDLDGWVVNAWRAIQWDPDGVAEAASWPVTEADKIARQLECCTRWANSGGLEHLMGDARWYDAEIAGWWLYGVCCQIGAWCTDGAWTVDERTGCVYKQERGTAREPGVSRKRPHLTDNGQGVNHARTREPGVSRIDADYQETEGFHPRTMPELRRWMYWLSARLRHVRVVNGDWRRVCTSGAMFTINVRQQGSEDYAAVFFDPPYSLAERDSGLYVHDAAGVAEAVRQWCVENTESKCSLRIVLAGFEGEGHEELARLGWTCHEWYRQGFLTGGMGNTNTEDGHQQARERLWASPSCIPAVTERRLFDGQ